MSLFPDLMNSERNPGDCWGRYSIPSRSVHDKNSDNSDNNPENDEVCLISPTKNSSRGLPRRSSARATRQQSPIEIKDDVVREAPRSNVDKSPQEFHVDGANFIIPKTKHQTETKNRSHNDSINSGKWFNAKNDSSCGRKNHTELEVQSASFREGSTRGSRNVKSPAERSNRVKLQRRWNHTSSPSRPVRSSPRNIRSRTINADNCHEADSLGRDEPVFNGNRQITSRFPKTCKGKQSRLRVRAENSGNTPVQKYISEESEENQNTKDEDVKETPSSKSSSGNPSDHVLIDDVFCPLCGGPMGKVECVKCQKLTADSDSQPNFITTDSFYSPLNHRNKNVITYSARRQNSQVTNKRNNPNKNRTGPAKKQAEINMPGLNQISSHLVPCKPSEERKGRKRRNDQTIKEPELVHISSDEEDKHEQISRKLQASEEEVTLAPQMDIISPDFFDVDFKEQERNETIQEDGDHEERQAPAEEHPGPTTTQGENSAMDLDLSDTKSPKMIKKRQRDRPKEQEDDSYQRDSLTTLLVAERICVGRLYGTTNKPVEVTAEKINISITRGEKDLQLKMEGRDLASFKINNDSDPAVVLIVPTSGWARKMNERYREAGMFIDPGSLRKSHCLQGVSQSQIRFETGIICTDIQVYEERQILLLLREKLKRTSLSDLMELIVERLADGKVWGTITPQEAEAEVQRILSSSNNRPKTDSSASEIQSIPQSFSSASAGSATSSFRKSYNTRSKDLPVANIPKKPPEKLLVYPPWCKHGGVTITTEDVECLQPDTYLNDVIIDFFMKYLMEEVLSDRDKERTHIFSSFFYNRLTQKNRNNSHIDSRTPEYMHSLVKTWTKNVDIFSKDFLIFPINECSHWYLSVVCYPALVAEQSNWNNGEEESWDGWTSPKTSEEMSESPTSESNETKDDSILSDGEQEAFETQLSKIVTRRKPKRKKSAEKVPLKSRPCILIFDSLGSRHRATVLVNLRNYLSCEWKERKGSRNKEPLKFDKDTLKGCYPKVPSQENMSDCGVYLLQYVQSFFQNPIKDYNMPINLPDWFPVEVVREKREFLRKLIYKLKDRVDVEDNS